MSFLKENMETIFLDILIDKKDIAFVSAVIESYEGVAFFRTVDPSIGHVLLMIPPAFIKDVDIILKDLNLSIRPLHKEQAIQDGFSFFNHVSAN